MLRRTLTIVNHCERVSEDRQRAGFLGRYRTPLRKTPD